MQLDFVLKGDQEFDVDESGDVAAQAVVSARRSLVGTPVGSLGYTLSAAKPLLRLGEAPLGDLVCDALILAAAPYALVGSPAPFLSSAPGRGP
jgi:hypothetical protein